MKKSSGKVVRYNKWGYIFLIPFIVVYVIFQLIPLISTIYNSFFENYMSGLTQVGPNFVGLANYKKLFSDGDIWIYTKTPCYYGSCVSYHRSFCHWYLEHGSLMYVSD